MTIAKYLKKLIEGRGGDPSGVQTIAQACKVLAELESAGQGTEPIDPNTDPVDNSDSGDGV